MIFYQMDGILEEGKNPMTNRVRTERGESFVCCVQDRCISVCVIMRHADRHGLQEFEKELCREFSLLPDSLHCRELTIDETHRLLNKGESEGRLLSADTVFAELGLSDFTTYPVQGISENVIGEPLSLDQARRACRELTCSGALEAELERIFSAPAADAPALHPVHYVILAETEDTRRKAKDILFRSLLSAGRLGNSRNVTLFGDRNSGHYRRFHQLFDMEVARAFYAGEKGGTIIVQPLLGTVPASEKEGRGGESADELCRLIRAHHRDVLTVMEGSSADEAFLRKMTAALPGITFVWIREDLQGHDDQLAYLSKRARTDGLPSEGLEQLLPASGKHLSIPALDRQYDIWLDRMLRTKAYPQYADLSAGREKEETLPVGTDYQKLQRMIGLGKVKALLDRILSYAKMQKYAREMGMPAGKTSLHMVFCGNPGTAKTTVARLFAGILRENGILSCGDLIEVGRGDLVDRYVGGTAPRVKEVFARAKGSVLFIDEAYSLLDDRAGSYGDEAISTIVQEMENAREDIAVIFAGYPKEMNRFLHRNPGLSSRIAFQVDFDDYTPEEMLEISRLIAGDRGKYIGSDAGDRILDRFRQEVRTPDFGNGRLARNMIEHACMRQAQRLMHRDCSPSHREMEVLEAEDFDLEAKSDRKEPAHRIGFAV